jgi:hypothetical protein
MSAAGSGRVFISYRRQESSGLAGRLYDRLAARFGNDQVFMDVDTIALGVDFAEVIAQAVSTCQVLLAVIGPRWLTVTDEDGRRRLDDPDDLVRLEIAAALERDIRVIPILVEGAAMPRRQQLPEALAGLAPCGCWRRWSRSCALQRPRLPHARRDTRLLAPPSRETTRAWKGHSTRRWWTCTSAPSAKRATRPPTSYRWCPIVAGLRRPDTSCMLPASQKASPRSGNVADST